MALLLDGEALAAKLRLEMAARVKALKAGGITPSLVTVMVGADEASLAYVGRKHQDCLEVGITSRAINLPDTTTEAELSAQIEALNADPLVHGFLVQLPLPAGLPEGEALAKVNPSKDIDGLHPFNLGCLLAGTPTVMPCTPAAVLALLEGYGITVAGKHVVVIGRGALVGRPLAMLLSLRGIDATVTLAHAKTPDLAKLVRGADIVISAAGQVGLVTADMITKGATVVGVGISYQDGAMVSDIATDVAAKAGAVTPPHGSVGALTRAMLLKNLLDLAKAR